MEQSLQENQMKVGQFKTNLLELQDSIDRIGQGVAAASQGKADSVPATAIQSTNERLGRLERQQVEFEQSVN